jgi:hypothetical protein
MKCTSGGREFQFTASASPFPPTSDSPQEHLPLLLFPHSGNQSMGLLSLETWSRGFYTRLAQPTTAYTFSELFWSRTVHHVSTVLYLTRTVDDASTLFITASFRFAP